MGDNKYSCWQSIPVLRIILVVKYSCCEPFSIFRCEDFGEKWTGCWFYAKLKGPRLGRFTFSENRHLIYVYQTLFCIFLVYFVFVSNFCTYLCVYPLYFNFVVFHCILSLFFAFWGLPHVCISAPLFVSPIKSFWGWSGVWAELLGLMTLQENVVWTVDGFKCHKRRLQRSPGAFRKVCSKTPEMWIGWKSKM